MNAQTKAPTLNYDDASELLGICKNTLYSLVSRGQIPHIRLSPRLVRFSRRDLEDWLSDHRVPVKSSTGKRRAA